MVECGCVGKGGLSGHDAHASASLSTGICASLEGVCTEDGSSHRKHDAVKVFKRHSKLRVQGRFVRKQRRRWREEDVNLGFKAS